MDEWEDTDGSVLLQHAKLEAGERPAEADALGQHHIRSPTRTPTSTSSQLLLPALRSPSQPSSPSPSLPSVLAHGSQTSSPLSAVSTGNDSASSGGSQPSPITGSGRKRKPGGSYTRNKLLLNQPAFARFVPEPLPLYPIAGPSRKRRAKAESAGESPPPRRSAGPDDAGAPRAPLPSSKSEAVPVNAAFVAVPAEARPAVPSHASDAGATATLAARSVAPGGPHAVTLAPSATVLGPVHGAQVPASATRAGGSPEIAVDSTPMPPLRSPPAADVAHDGARPADAATGILKPKRQWRKRTAASGLLEPPKDGGSSVANGTESRRRGRPAKHARTAADSLPGPLPGISPVHNHVDTPVLLPPATTTAALPGQSDQVGVLLEGGGASSMGAGRDRVYTSTEASPEMAAGVNAGAGTAERVTEAAISHSTVTVAATTPLPAPTAIDAGGHRDDESAPAVLADSVQAFAAEIDPLVVRPPSEPTQSMTPVPVPVLPMEPPLLAEAAATASAEAPMSSDLHVVVEPGPGPEHDRSRYVSARV